MNRRTRFGLTLTTALLLTVAMNGCVPPPAQEVKKDEKKGGSILNQTTTEVGEWDPNGGQKIRVEDGSDMNMINYSLKAGAISDIAKMKTQQSLEMYRATTGGYPKTYQEFMDEVFAVYIKELPMPVTSCEYQYDVANHKLLLVEKTKETDK